MGLYYLVGSVQQYSCGTRDRQDGFGRGRRWLRGQKGELTMGLGRWYGKSFSGVKMLKGCEDGDMLW